MSQGLRGHFSSLYVRSPKLLLLLFLLWVLRLFLHLCLAQVTCSNKLYVSLRGTTFAFSSSFSARHTAQVTQGLCVSLIGSFLCPLCCLFDVLLGFIPACAPIYEAQVVLIVLQIEPLEVIGLPIVATTSLPLSRSVRPLAR